MMIKLMYKINDSQVAFGPGRFETDGFHRDQSLFFPASLAPRVVEYRCRIADVLAPAWPVGRRLAVSSFSPATGARFSPTKSSGSHLLLFIAMSHPW